MPYGAFFRDVFSYFGPFFAKNGSFYSKIERNRTVFDHFENDAVVFALICEVLQLASQNKDLLRFFGANYKDL